MEEESLSEKADKVSVDMGETQALMEKEELEEKGDEEKNKEMRLDMEETEEKAHEKVDEGKSEEVKIDMEVTEEKAKEKNVDGESYGKLVEELRHQFVEGTSTPLEFRVRQLEGFRRMLVEQEAVLLAALKADLNKPTQESIMGEIDFLKNDIIGLLRHLKDWMADQPVDKSPLTVLDKVMLHPEPFGVVLVIGAWNYPLQLTLGPVFPAIAAGNCAVIKPSEIAPATSSAIAALVPQYLDPRTVRVVEGGVPETTLLLKERFDYIFYTGSTQVGRIVGAAANVHLTPCTLELGGKSPAYVGDGIEGDKLRVVARRLLWGKFNNAGQICVAPDYVLCSAEVEARLTPVMEQILVEWYSENPEQSPDYCKIVSTRHTDRLLSLLASTKGRVVVGGSGDRGRQYIQPTLVTGVTPQDPLMQEEIFGPILPIVRVDSAKEAVLLVNRGEKPLALYVFSEDNEVHQLFKCGTSSGGLLINDTVMHLTVEQLPFGGVGHSGMGSYHGKFGFDTFTHNKPVMVRNLGWLGEALGNFRYPPYKEKALPTIRNMIVNRSLPSCSCLPGLLLFLFGLAVGVLILIAFQLAGLL